MRRLDPAGIDEYGQMAVLQPGEHEAITRR
jgi:hypothetical protein